VDRCSVSQKLGAQQTPTTDTFLFISLTTNVLLFKFRCNIFNARFGSEWDTILSFLTTLCGRTYTWPWNCWGLINPLEDEWMGNERKEGRMGDWWVEWMKNRYMSSRMDGWMDAGKCNKHRVSPSWFYYPNNISQGVQFLKLLILYSFLLLCHLILCRSKSLHLHLFSNILSLLSFLNVRYQVSHPYKTIGKIIVLCILIFTCWVANRKTDSATNYSKHSLN